MPWYERADFHELWALSADQHNVPRDYDVWHAEASRALQEYLAMGKALQVVTIRPAAYLQWLGQAPNTSSMRRTYVEYLAAGVERPATIEVVA
jgi:hypothetical protein